MYIHAYQKKMWKCTCAHRYTYIHMYIHVNIHTYTHVHTYIHTYTYIHTCIHVYIRAQIHFHNACIHTYTYTYIQLTCSNFNGVWNDKGRLGCQKKKSQKSAS